MLKFLLYLIVIVVIIVVAFFIYATIDDYKPQEIISLSENPSAKTLSLDTISIMTWNIGYCGMDRTIDFFYDGGKQTRVSKKQTLENIHGIKKFLKKEGLKHDFVLLQEVDINAKRSYHTNQLDTFKQVFANYKSFLGINYKVSFIPVPVLKPYGNVEAGIVTFSKYEPYKVLRYQYPGNYAWPTKLFMLDRCFVVARYKLNNGNDLLIINLHNSAFDDGSLRAKQLDYLKKFVLEEYQKGNYIVIGGDWNQRPPNFVPTYKHYIFNKNRSKPVSDTIFPADWNFVFQTEIPTNRDADKVWDKSKVPVTTIDFFLTSPNVSVVEIKAFDLNFENTDHNPVVAKFILKQ